MSDLEHSRELQEKFELYLLALIFTILGLAIQTAKLGVSHAADILEILGWVSLMVSGMVGLSRLEWVPVALKSWHQLQILRQGRQQLADLADGGVQRVPVEDEPEPVDIQTLLASRDEDIKKAQAFIDRIDRRVHVKYDIHKWTFVFGLVLLVAARAYVPVVGMFGDTAQRATCASATSRPLR
ncbi:hypothetical protein [Paraburkholderia fungorum]|uniref:SMODS and SLOG-associating 2TM effector domain-containing protein n=1 Tax=Paraburkholderia fungorum TaxID=134537 RepID=A0AAW3UZZ5_9BURK|nr:hypothetical protein [Paraburkholderia fungorum]MBB4515851.1 hypothetical protein [Paraburkholderia fungorum]MBB6203733.1 hypothetical protein [Paraburkholderia fungorum]